ncbi:MAG: hypothetical protein IJE89_03975 [Bacilli bacterium]|nr:hypothetical protein [Bacilli bacterium]
MKLNFLKSNKKNIFMYIVLTFACLDTITRLPMNSGISIFRILSVIILLYGIFYKNFKLKKAYLFMIGVFIYSLLMVLIWDGSIAMHINNFIHWLFIFAIFVCMIILKNSNNFKRNFLIFLDIFTLVTIVIFYIEYFTGLRFFQLFTAGYDLPSVFYYGINDCASALVAVGVLYILEFVNEYNIFNLIKCIIIIITIFLLGARASVLVLGVAILLVCILKIMKSIVDKKKRNLFLLGMLVFIIAIIIINPTIDDETLVELIAKPLIQIFKLEVIDTRGSVTIRATAIVLGLKELIRTFGFGIGLGNCTLMLTRQGFSTLGSMHNMLIQVWTELGWFSIFMFYKLISKTIKKYKNDVKQKRKNSKSYYGLIMLIIAPLLGMQSSEGLLSIYIVWMTMFYAFLITFDNSED